jgi:quercetin dioxygenase-like cupin family protein
MNEEELISKMKREGYDEVYIWNAKPKEDDPNHTHLFDAVLIILSGEIEIGMDGEKRILRKGDTITIPQLKNHSGLAGPDGCRYIVAEKY